MRICPTPGCGVLVTRGKCPKHRTSNLNRRAWRRRSLLERTANPLCADCLAQGRFVPATQVHHTTKRADGGALLGGDLISLCTSHHSIRTRQGE